MVVAMNANIQRILDRAVAAERLTPDEGQTLFECHDLHALGRAADAVCRRLHPEPYRTYNIDRNINYTNVCNANCNFCAFYRVEKDSDAYVITLDEMDKKIAETVALGGTQILMQGGHHPKLTKQWYLDLLSHIKTKWPQVNVHGFSPSEFIHFREVFNEPLEDTHPPVCGGGAWLDSRWRRGDSRGSRPPARGAAQGDEQTTGWTSWTRRTASD